MRKIPVLLGLLALCNFAFSQAPQQPFKRCATYESMQEFQQLNPFAQTDQQFETWLQQKIRERRASAAGRENVAYTIPIIFHIVHNGEAIGTGSNLSATKIASQLAQLNADYANLSGSLYGVSANMEIQFCLAQRTPAGAALAEPGIERIDRNAMTWDAPPYAGQASNSYVDVTIIPTTIWDPNQYFNVWTMALSGGLLGKATFPTGSTLPGLGAGETDTHAGVFIEYRSAGSISDPGSFGASAGLGRTLSHEAGHFFGLRHIWGDALCGNDFCNDTPPQDEDTGGCPVQPAANNCTPAVNKMFENYMDYTFDACVNTFTADQKIRMQTVMANSPRRIQLATSLGCVPPVANSIAFTAATASASEAPTVLTCPAYREITVTVRVAVAASGPATVTFTKAGTATDNVDYTITPASVSFLNGGTDDKVVTIRIWDDAVVESPETIILGYTITGAGVVAGSSNQTQTITITDNDVAPVINNSGTVTLLNENFGTSGNSLPAGWLSGDFLGGTSVNVWRIASEGGPGITGQAAYVTNNTTTYNLEYTTTVSSRVVIRTPALNAAGLSNVRLSFTYKCNGEADVDGIYDFGTLYYSLNGTTFSQMPNPMNQPYIFQGVPNATTISNIPIPSFLTGTFYIGFVWQNDDSFGDNPPFLIDDVVIAADATRIEEQITNAGTANIFSGQNALIMSGNDRQVIARINNPSANLGCVTATVTSAGTAQIGVNTTSGAYLRTQKIIRITPSVPAPGVTYQATLYFSTAELALWGSNRLTLKILKIQDGVDLNSTTLSAANTEIITPASVVENAAEGYIMYTANFTGFSQFVLASANITLPVNLITFNAKPAGRMIQLKWSTAQEDNNKGFFIERSANGSDYKDIDWVDGKGNTTSRVDYQYNDNFVQPGVMYYYRLRQRDFDGNEKKTVIRTAIIEEKGTIITLTPNPTKDKVKLFISGSASPVNLNIINTQGQIVRSWKQVNASLAPVPLDVSGLSAGMYMVHIQLAGETRVERLVIQ